MTDEHVNETPKSERVAGHVLMPDEELIARLLAEMASIMGAAGVAVEEPVILYAECHNRLTALLAEVERLENALRLIELLGYREGEDFGWINAHMRGVASSALTGQPIDHYWRLFPKHRPPARAALAQEARTDD